MTPPATLVYNLLVAGSSSCCLYFIFLLGRLEILLGPPKVQALVGTCIVGSLLALKLFIILNHSVLTGLINIRSKRKLYLSGVLGGGSLIRRRARGAVRMLVAVVVDLAVVAIRCT